MAPEHALMCRNESLKAVGKRAADAGRRQIMDDREARLTQQPKPANPGETVLLLSPQGFRIGLPRPLYLDRDPRVSLHREDVSSPWFAGWRCAGHFGCGLPARGSRDLDRHHLQMTMLFAFVG